MEKELLNRVDLLAAKLEAIVPGAWEVLLYEFVLSRTIALILSVLFVALPMWYIGSGRLDKLGKKSGALKSDVEFTQGIVVIVTGKQREQKELKL